MGEKTEAALTEDEAAIYDRQIRLWGLDAQKRMYRLASYRQFMWWIHRYLGKGVRTELPSCVVHKVHGRLRAARALLVGMGGLGAEVAKNIVLAGLKSLTVLDHRQVTEEDACSQFLVDRKDSGKNRAQASLEQIQQLNPMVEVSADTTEVADKPDEFFANFDLVCVTCSSCEQMMRINKICHNKNIKFYGADVFGYYGFMFADLIEHEYAQEIQQKVKEKSGDGDHAAKSQKTDVTMETVVVKKSASFVTLENAFSVDWSAEDKVKVIKRTPAAYFIIQVLLRFRSLHGRDPDTGHVEADQAELLRLRDCVLDEMKIKRAVVGDEFASHCVAQLSPVCAIVGGVLGQEIIKAVSQKDAPHNNFFFYDGAEGGGTVDFIGR